MLLLVLCGGQRCAGAWSADAVGAALHLLRGPCSNRHRLRSRHDGRGSRCCGCRLWRMLLHVYPSLLLLILRPMPVGQRDGHTHDVTRHLLRLPCGEGLVRRRHGGEVPALVGHGNRGASRDVSRVLEAHQSEDGECGWIGGDGLGCFGVEEVDAPVLGVLWVPGDVLEIDGQNAHRLLCLVRRHAGRLEELIELFLDVIVELLTLGEAKGGPPTHGREPPADWLQFLLL
mmetsp:Transcript_7282/g.20974  ORF Transcript_7282/g.20974 Transcript_7282/m.20974 type:complete len:230 (-) Transcript_7282:1040-1729(-)